MISSRSRALNFNADGLTLDFFSTLSVEGVMGVCVNYKNYFDTSFCKLGVDFNNHLAEIVQHNVFCA